MALGRINGPMLQTNLERQGVNIALDANLTYWDVNNRFVGINNTVPNYPLDISGNLHAGNLYILGNTIQTDPGFKLDLGTIANITIAGGSANYLLVTDGTGSLSFTSFGNIVATGAVIIGNSILLGSTTTGSCVWMSTARRCASIWRSMRPG